ncbi:MAG: type I polyketide synthase, partial [Pedobacter sp.]
IQGWGVNQDGKTNGITAPNAESQKALIQDVYDKYHIDPNSIQLIEAHGTGTKLGDPIEIEGLTESFKKYTQNKHYCALGSVKSNIGHCLTAAGMSGFIKLMLALQHKKLPPTIHFEKLNEHIGLDNTPFYVNSKLQHWDLNGAEKRQAAVSSFGFSGTNAHVVVAEYVNVDAREPSSVITQNGKFIIPLSAKNNEQLQQKAADLLKFIQANEPINFLNLAYTLQVGRDAMEERLGFLVSSVDQLASKISAYIKGEKDIEDVYQGQVKSNKAGMSIISQDDDMRETIINKWINTNRLSKVLDLWVKGLEFDWSKLYGTIKPQRITLPNYPFAKERYWIDAVETIHVKSAVASPEVFHPLLHSRTSDLIDQGYSSSFSGSSELIVSDAGSKNKLQRISLPTYPFAKVRCWIQSAPQQNYKIEVSADKKLKLVKNLESIEDIINKIDDESIETNQAVKLLKTLA